MSKKEAPHDADNRPAVGGPVERMVRAHPPERAAFEARFPGCAKDRCEAGTDYCGDECRAGWEAWQAAVAVEREQCIATLRALKNRSGVNDDGQSWLVRLTRGDCVKALAARAL